MLKYYIFVPELHFDNLPVEKIFSIIEFGFIGLEAFYCKSN